MVRTILHVAAAAALVLAAMAVPAAAQGLDENLLIDMPEGFRVGRHAEDETGSILELVPIDGTAAAGASVITVQIFNDLGGSDGGAFATELGQRWLSDCALGEAGPVTEGEVNGYPFVVWGFSCPESPRSGEAESMWLKAISGTDAFYAVQYAHRGAATGERALEAFAYLVEVSVCDKRLPDRACPADIEGAETNVVEGE